MALFDFLTKKSRQPAQVRKFLNEKKLEKQGIPINTNLPVVDDYKSVKFRSPKDVVRRIMVLSAVIDAAHNQPNASKADAVAWLTNSGLRDYVADSEIHFLTGDTHDDALRPQMSWRVEAQKVLFWSLGLIDKLNFPSELSKETNEAHEKGRARFGTIKDFINQARLRDHEEILDELDYTFRLHWAVRQASSTHAPMPGNAHSGIVYERHYAFNWLICYANAWDDVTCDTEDAMPA